MALAQGLQEASSAGAGWATSAYRIFTRAETAQNHIQGTRNQFHDPGNDLPREVNFVSREAIIVNEDIIFDPTVRAGSRSEWIHCDPPE